MAIRKDKYGDIKLGGEEIKRTSEQLKSRKEVFRGFIPGSSIRTSKGYVGSKLDSLWARNIIESLVNDDEELLNIALESSIADVTCVVEGGEYGSPYCLDNYGFYSANQFIKQHEALKAHERDLVADKNALFLSDREWEYVDVQLGRYAKYKGADPLIYNEVNEDLMSILVQIYAELNESIQLNFRQQKDMCRTIMLPLQVQSVLKTQDLLKQKIVDLHTFLVYLIENFNARIKNIEEDKWTMRKMTLRKQDVPFELRWNVEQEDRVQRQVKVMLFVCYLT
jgi:hypothetical protein